MIDGIVEVGPAVVLGPHQAPRRLICAAIEYLDDELGLLDDHAVPVRQLWSEVMHAVIGADGADDQAVVLVCPTWWSAARIDLVRHAALSVVPDVSVRARGPLLAHDATRGGSVVVEIAAELIVVVGRGPATVIPILDDIDAVAANVRCAVGMPTAVLIDAAAGVDGATRMGDAIAQQLHAHGMLICWADDDAVRRAAATSQSRGAVDAECAAPVHHLRAAPAAAVVVAAAVAIGALAVGGGGEQQAVPTRLLVEGRIGVLVPGGWPTHRISSGPGSARIQLVSPSDDAVALHLTQSVATAQVDLVGSAASLQAALAAESSDVFVDFKPSDIRAGRPAVTYREVRRDRQVAWTVLAEGSVRIAIGCQSPVAREDLIRAVCDRAIESAYATG